MIWLRSAENNEDNFSSVFFVWPMLRYVAREIWAVWSKGHKHARGTYCFLRRHKTTATGAYAEMYSCLFGKHVGRCKTQDTSKLLAQKVEKFMTRRSFD